MPKRRISKQQFRRIRKIQEARSVQARPLETGTAVPARQDTTGLLITHYGKYADVEYQEKVYRCHFRQNLDNTVVGDEVVFHLDKDEMGVITAIAPRRNLLWRQDEKQQQKALAANIDQMIIVIAPEPEPSALLLDSYLVAAEILNIEPLILFNKVDLVLTRQYEAWIHGYEKLGYTLIKASTVTDYGLNALTLRLRDKTSIFTGQSGVGKTSLIQALLPDEKLSIGDLHESARLGRHTTSTSRLYHLPTGGSIIDSPGIREFSLWPLSAQQFDRGFREFQTYASQCKFRDCTHAHEPDCRVLTALAQGEISQARWESYQFLLRRR